MKAMMPVDIEELYRELPLVQHENYPIVIQERFRFMLRAIEEYRSRIGKEREDLRILDVACGIGKNAFFLAHLNYEVFGLDNGQETLDYLNENNPYPNFHPFFFDIETGDYRTLPENVDVVLVSAILEHLVDPARVLRNLLRRVSPPCLVLGHVPNDYGASELANALRQWVGRHWGHAGWYRRLAGTFRVKTKGDASDSATLTDTPHIYQFLSWNVRQFFEDVGIKEVCIENSNFLTGTVILHKLLLLGTERMQKLDTRFSKWLPKSLGNGWDFSGEFRPE